MTKDIDMFTMVNSRAILPLHRDQLEEEIKDIFIWAIGQTVGERQPKTFPLWRLYALFKLHYTPEKNKHQNRADFFEGKREPGESASDVWKRILATKQNCKFEEITGGRTADIKVPIGNRKHYGRQGAGKQNKTWKYDLRRNHRCHTRTHV